MSALHSELAHHSPPFQVVDIGGERLTKTGEGNVAGWRGCTTVLGATAAAGNFDGFTGLAAAMKRYAISSLVRLLARSTCPGMTCPGTLLFACRVTSMSMCSRRAKWIFRCGSMDRVDGSQIGLRTGTLLDASRNKLQRKVIRKERMK